MAKSQERKNTMKNLFAIDFTENTIIASKTTLKKAGVPNSPEYKELKKLMEQNPTFTVAEKEIKEPARKTTYKGLDFKTMRAYINAQDNADDLMAEFETAMQMLGGKYPLIKKWFLATFKDETNGFKMSEVKKTVSNAKVSLVKATIKRASANQPTKSVINL